MNCTRVTPNTNGPNEINNNTEVRGVIYDTIKRIEQQQKEAIIESECTGCRSSLITRVFDTKPVTFTLENDAKFTAFLGLTNERTDLFRIEDVLRDCVLLRLLDKNAGRCRCTDFSVILEIEPIVGMQCFEPINCNVRENFHF